MYPGKSLFAGIEMYSAKFLLIYIYILYTGKYLPDFIFVPFT